MHTHLYHFNKHKHTPFHTHTHTLTQKDTPTHVYTHTLTLWYWLPHIWTNVLALFLNGAHFSECSMRCRTCTSGLLSPLQFGVLSSSPSFTHTHTNTHTQAHTNSLSLNLAQEEDCLANNGNSNDFDPKRSKFVVFSSTALNRAFVVGSGWCVCVCVLVCVCLHVWERERVAPVSGVRLEMRNGEGRVGRPILFRFTIPLSLPLPLSLSLSLSPTSRKKIAHTHTHVFTHSLTHTHTQRHSAEEKVVHIVNGHTKKPEEKPKPVSLSLRNRLKKRENMWKGKS